ncbi:MAG: hypothetical protein KKA19_03565 [Candidatus Margulisbacteria bacterium]|nr:hypothetical protein [Candidatus Margulisiibacteriota bacterium]
MRARVSKNESLKKAEDIREEAVKIIENMIKHVDDLTKKMTFVAVSVKLLLRSEANTQNFKVKEKFPSGRDCRPGRHSQRKQK